MYEYKAKLVRVIDGDTIDVDIDLGFKVFLQKNECDYSALTRLKAEQETWKKKSWVWLRRLGLKSCCQRPLL